ncbi:hypothetical protein [Phocicoccus pinnipedialis]|uniref:NAD(P)-binding domain-containing protein n=1 Tax=Phocicoccus pinnipedialis TaxID=110845 RepID=A0A6V7R0H8_9BACL|nr:hypothetical protein [Jeotgalicoccus pinnipedialis]MBP1938723.1 hypothetical protein [Jeotgalicoccus pinnipedialis]CAD2070533.1 hypothetical protein JEOPIN946_00033 [Jeotgalicoccus pinnipedialis]
MAKILLMGVYGEVGQSLYDSLKENNEIYAFINPDKPSLFHEINWLDLDFYELDDMREAVAHMDIVIFHEDPIMRFARLNQGRFDTFLQLIADNLGRAAEASTVKQIIYVSEEIEHEEVKEILSAYQTPVTHTNTKILRYGKSLKYKNPSNHTMRSAQRAHIPDGWTLEDVAKYYFKWLDTIVFGVVEIEVYDDTIEITFPTLDKAMLIMERDRENEEERMVLLKVVGGSLLEKGTEAKFEFRALPDNKTFIMMLHDFKSRLPWTIYKMTQAPLHGLVSRIYQVEMVINNTLLEENQKNKPE